MAKKTIIKNISKPSARQKILIVDDEQDILTSMKMLVESMGYEAKTANNGKKALAALKKERFDLIFLDLLMPEMSGREVLEKIRANPKLKNQMVAFLTVVQLSKPGEEIIKKLKPDAYIMKPIDVADFRKKIKKLLDKADKNGRKR